MVAWSFSALEGFESCPHRYKLEKVTKQAKFVDTAETLWGKEVHKAFENRVGANAPLPPRMAAYEPIMQTLMAKPGDKDVEQQWALTKEFMPTDWFNKQVWVRVVCDLMIFSPSRKKLFLGDYKTGKKKPKSGQLRLSAAVAMHQFPDVEEIISAFIWLVDGSITAERFTRADEAGIWQEFMPRVARLDAAVASGNFPKKPSGLCKNWCSVGKALCEHCGS